METCCIKELDILIIEGADHTGKTTTARRLTELSAARGKYPTYYQHYSCPNSVFNWFDDYKDAISQYAIIDRFHISGICYQGRVKYNALRAIEGWLSCLGTYTVLMAADVKWYKAWIKKSDKPQMFSKRTNIEVAERYERIGRRAFDFPVRVDQVIWVDQGFPDDTVLETILDCWYDLLSVFNGNL